MNIEYPSLLESKQNFHTKMNAARFFLERIKKIYKPESISLKSIPNELFYYTDATIFELHAASQILLQIINSKANINKNANEVNGGRIYQELLKNSNRSLYDWWQNFNISPEFHTLEGMRQYISHRGGTFLQAEIDNNETIKLISVPIRFRYYKNKPELKPTGKSIELIDELESIGNFLNLKYKELIET